MVRKDEIRNVGKIPTAAQQEDLILWIVINAEENVRCVMVFKGIRKE